MNRATNGIDRQRTNMYWPEEENSPSIHEYSPSRNGGNGRPSSRASSSRTSSVSHDSFGDDVNTREMVRKQQESKIQFYDYDQSVVPPSRTITPSSAAKNLSRESPEVDPTNRKLQTLKSRIEFYDYVDEAPPAPPRGNSRGNATKDAARGAGISESETRSVNKATRDSNFIQETYAPEDRTDGRTTTTTTKKSGRTINHTPTSNRSQKVENHSQSNIRQVPIKVEAQETNRKSPSSPGYNLVQRKQLSSSVIDLSTLDLDDPELEQLKQLNAAKTPSKNEINKKLATFHTEIRVSNNNSNKSPVSSNSGAKNSPPQVNLHADHDDDDDRSAKRLTRNRDPVSPTPSSCTEDAPNEARRMAHRHLQSSFAFGKEPAKDTNGAGSLGRRSYSIRDTAVCRVGVGLPDL